MTTLYKKYVENQGAHRKNKKGFYFGPLTLDYLAMITFHLYSILVVATAWFIYSLCEYGINIYVPERKWLLIVAIIFCASFTIIALTAHLGII
jgi:hypothetical protein